MSYQCKLSIEQYEGGYSKGFQPQLSPLIFSSNPDCYDFATRMFEPPETVKDWEVVSTDKKANAKMIEGVVRVK